jgi:hypothetical protein
VTRESAAEKELRELAASQERVLGQLKEAQVLLDRADRERDRLVEEARRLAVPWWRIGDATWMTRQRAWRRWRG